jgi:hypothetical protein
MAEEETLDHADVVEWCIKLYPGDGDCGPERREREPVRQAPPKRDGTS